MKVQNIKISLSENWMVPTILLGVCVAAYGLQIPWLGYTLDDWIILHSYSTAGLNGLMEYSFLDSRPLIFWIWELGFLLAGKAPLGWHLFTLAWRFATVWMFWTLLREFWPRHTRQTALTATLFAVYPLFFQQPSAMTFSFHWVCHFLVLLSLFWMVRAVRTPKRWLAYSAGSILAGAAALFSQEFFVGYELLRPLLIWIALPKQTKWKDNLKPTIFQWTPYALLLAGYLVWRLVLMPVPGTDRNTPQALSNLLASPLKSLPTLAVMVVRDIVQSVAGVWSSTYEPKLISLNPVSALAAWGIAILVFAILTLIFLRTKFMHSIPEEVTPDSFAKPAIWVGMAALLVGFAPGWSIGRSITASGSLYNDRFGLAAMAGLSLLVVGLVEALIRSWRARTVIILLLVGLAVGAHFRSTTDYRWSWEQQRRLFWQLKWRAPQLESPTAIFGDGALVKFMGSWANTSAINELYGKTVDTKAEPYWYLDLTKTSIPAYLMTGEPVEYIKNNLRYHASIQQSLIIQADALPVQCLWVVSEADEHNPYLTIEARDGLAVSDISRILPDDGTLPDPAIFGPEPAHDWCFYYEKAVLAEQNGDWAEVMRLWNEAGAGGYSPNNEPEYMPFIRAAAMTGDWQLAQDLTKRAYFPYYVMHDYLCTTWRDIRDQTMGEPGQAKAIEAVTVDFDCQAIMLPNQNP